MYHSPAAYGNRLPLPIRHSRLTAIPAHTVIPAPHRHSRESGNPRPGLSPGQTAPGFWIPAYAGMTVGAGRSVMLGCGFPLSRE